uniref:Pkinase_fungal domain-containing protein n=1 Tax=Steinernema glaseri TaxID=37863 RepID=A0A1I7Z5D4_9BILA
MRKRTNRGRALKVIATYGRVDIVHAKFFSLLEYKSHTGHSLSSLYTNYAGLSRFITNTEAVSLRVLIDLLISQVMYLLWHRFPTSCQMRPLIGIVDWSPLGTFLWRDSEGYELEIPEMYSRERVFKGPSQRVNLGRYSLAQRVISSALATRY